MIRAAKRAGGAYCCVCVGHLDLDLSGRHPDGPTIEHRIALHDGGDEHDPANIAGLAHNRCNSGKENRRRAERRREAAQAPTTASRAW